MMDEKDHRISAYISERFGICAFRTLALIALTGCAALLFCDLMTAMILEDYSLMSMTISDLASSEYEIIMDIGLYVFALGIAALGFGLGLRSTLTRKGLIVRIALAVLAVSMALMAVFDGAGEPFDFHDVLVIFSALAVPVILWFSADLDIANNPKLNRLSRSTAVAWIILAPPFQLIPEVIMGAYERLLTLIVVAAIAIAAIQLYRTPRLHH